MTFRIFTCVKKKQSLVIIYSVFKIRKSCAKKNSVLSKKLIYPFIRFCFWKASFNLNICILIHGHNQLSLQKDWHWDNWKVSLPVFQTFDTKYQRKVFKCKVGLLSDCQIFEILGKRSKLDREGVKILFNTLYLLSDVDAISKRRFSANLWDKWID